MKKIFALALAAALVLTMCVAALADKVDGVANQDSNALITTSIEPTYTVTIPGDVKVRFNDNKTEFGVIYVEASQIHPDRCIKVALTSDGELNNSIDDTKVIPYVVKDSKGAEFTFATYLTKGEATQLFIHITSDDWNKAYAGDYSDTVIFTISYEDKN